MIILDGKYNSAKIFTNNIDNETISQIIQLLNQPFIANSQIRIMPDCHAGAGCVIGTTMTIKDKVVPNLVGVDIGCGMAVVNIGKRINLNLEKLDNFIKENIPCGQEVFNKEENYSDLDNLKCKNNINMNRAKCSIGTLGGGNHFIEVDKNNNDDIYIVVHSGSRYLGKQIAEYYQNKAYKGLTDYSEQINKTIENLKSQGKYTEISNAISNIKHQNPKIPKDLAFVDDVNFDNYLFDMNIAQRYAYCNRTKMINTIVKYLGITEITEKFQTIHNYIDIQNKILRKGAISAQTNEKVIIPMNMRDGSLICMGKGNPDWNCSAPHGAGRIMSRSQAKENVTLNEFIKSMEGIYTTTVNTSTIDESPMAYKPMNEIIKNIQDTVEIKNIIKPIYNFKASN